MVEENKEIKNKLVNTNELIDNAKKEGIQIGTKIGKRLGILLMSKKMLNNRISKEKILKIVKEAEESDMAGIE